MVAERFETILGEIKIDDTWTEKDLKRLDKAATVMKVGFKLIKLVLHRHGARKVKPVHTVYAMGLPHQVGLTVLDESHFLKRN
jgi:hypothetical protein